ncbi:hypothetical protein, partial [Salmonella enterica]|uniref:hypothetical protein n=1 Tax=Salmonella enterica TaxID=28901 RepID=UPI002EA050F0|nr:hypothetical protein [Salmonella enterica subsp. enterica serovar Paratyphi A]
MPRTFIPGVVCSAGRLPDQGRRKGFQASNTVSSGASGGISTIVERIPVACPEHLFPALSVQRVAFPTKGGEKASKL